MARLRRANSPDLDMDLGFDYSEPRYAPYQAPTYDAGTTAPTPSTQPNPNVSFAGFDTGKMNTDHAAGSPKYAFQQVFQNYGYDQAGDAFKQLQEQYPDFFGNWEFSGRDKIRYSGQGDLHDKFGGITEFDIMSNSMGQGPQQWTWQFDDPNFMAQPAIGGGGQFNFNAGGGGGGSFGGGGSVGTSFSGPKFGEEVMQQLRGLFPGGAFNQDIVNRRTELAREDLERSNRSRMSNNRALLADRGLIGSGPEFSEAFSRESDIADQYANAVSGIYANESENADARMMQALQLAAGLTSDEARLLIDQFRAQTDRDLGFGNLGLGYHRANQDFTLGQGNLALGNMRAVNDYNMGLANYGLNRDQLQWQMDQGGIDNLIRLLQLYMGGAGTAAGGYI